jgi:FtsZ-interacting cell division protein ZipA
MARRFVRPATSRKILSNVRYGYSRKNHMKTKFWGRLAFAASLCFVAQNAFSQAAYRCDVAGATVYSEMPCVGGAAVAPTQDSSLQQKRSTDAAKQMSADDRAVSARISDRSKDEAKERADIRKAQIAAYKQEAKEKAKAEKKAKKKTAPKLVVKNVPKPKRAKSGDNRGSAPAKV